LAARRTVKAMELVLEHSKMTTLSVEQLGVCIRNAISGRRDELEKNFEILESKEREADSLRRKIIEELARGELAVEEREGLMRLGRQIDWITDWSHEASRILILFDLSQMPKQIQDLAVEMCTTVSEATRKVADSVQMLIDGDLQASLAAADEVERREERVDKLYQQSRGILKGIKTNGITVGSMILVAQFLEAIEHTADRCEDTCDQVRVMAVTLSKQKG